ncbi:GNAT family N-acetyltransferase [Allomeiothermus silvanus]|uniref:GNAT family N-acetyltransferase n=1 Tax=Allomeiothermus silvanus TaxID=52022 RepID=UPI003AF35795
MENTTIIVQSRANGRLVGILRAFSDGVSTTHLSEILVHPAFRGQGIGTALMQAFLAGQPPTSLVRLAEARSSLGQ